MTITVPTSEKRQVVDITDKITREVADQNGLVTIFASHSTVGITTANLDPGTDLDLLDALETLLPQRQWRHQHNPEHTRDHLLASIIGPSLTVPVRGGRLMLGTWQRIVLVELNGPQARNVEVTVIGSGRSDSSLML